MEERTYNLIEDYLEGNLSKEELTAFQARLQNDAKLAQKVTLFEEVEMSLGDPIRQDIKGQLQTLGEAYFQQSVVKKKIKRLPFYQRSWVRAASFLLIVSFGFLFWQYQTPTAALSNQELFSQNYQSPNLDAMVRGTTTDDTLQEIIGLYKKQEYSAVLPQLKTLQQAAPANQKINYLLAHTYLNLSPPQMVEAINIFKKLIEHQQNVYVPKAQWYLGLIYIQQDNIEAAKPLLQAVVEAKDSNTEKAQKIIKDLK